MLSTSVYDVYSFKRGRSLSGAVSRTRFQPASTDFVHSLTSVKAWSVPYSALSLGVLPPVPSNTVTTAVGTLDTFRCHVPSHDAFGVRRVGSQPHSQLRKEFHTSPLTRGPDAVPFFSSSTSCSFQTASRLAARASSTAGNLLLRPQPPSASSVSLDRDESPLNAHLRTEKEEEDEETRGFLHVHGGQHTRALAINEGEEGEAIRGGEGGDDQNSAPYTPSHDGHDTVGVHTGAFKHPTTSRTSFSPSGMRPGSVLCEAGATSSSYKTRYSPYAGAHTDDGLMEQKSVTGDVVDRPPPATHTAAALSNEPSACALDANSMRYTQQPRLTSTWLDLVVPPSPPQPSSEAVAPSQDHRDVRSQPSRYSNEMDALTPHSLIHAEHGSAVEATYSGVERSRDTVCETFEDGTSSDVDLHRLLRNHPHQQRRQSVSCANEAKEEEEREHQSPFQFRKTATSQHATTLTEAAKDSRTTATPAVVAEDDGEHSHRLFDWETPSSEDAEDAEKPSPDPSRHRQTEDGDDSDKGNDGDDDDAHDTAHSMPLFQLCVTDSPTTKVDSEEEEEDDEEEEERSSPSDCFAVAMTSFPRTNWPPSATAERRRRRVGRKESNERSGASLRAEAEEEEVANAVNEDTVFTGPHTRRAYDSLTRNQRFHSDADDAAMHSLFAFSQVESEVACSETTAPLTACSPSQLLLLPLRDKRPPNAVSFLPVSTDRSPLSSTARPMRCAIRAPSPATLASFLLSPSCPFFVPFPFTAPSLSPQAVETSATMDFGAWDGQPIHDDYDNEPVVKGASSLTLPLDTRQITRGGDTQQLHRRRRGVRRVMANEEEGEKEEEHEEHESDGDVNEHSRAEDPQLNEEEEEDQSYITAFLDEDMAQLEQCVQFAECKDWEQMCAAVDAEADMR